MNPRDILLEMRKQRELELIEFQSILSKIEHPFLHHLENMVSKRKAVLTLELPFKSDSVSLNQALVKESFDNKDTSEKSLEAWAQSDYNTFEGKYIKNSFKQFLQTKWPKVTVMSYTKSGTAKAARPQDIPFEDLSFEAPCLALIQTIEQSNLRSSSKQVYSSYARNVIAFSRGVKSKGQLQPPKQKGIEANILADYFEHLEWKCLNSWSEDVYKDLIEARLLFYAPLKGGHLNKITLNNIQPHNQLLRYNEECFLLPKTFIELLQAIFTGGESVFNRRTKILYKFIIQTASTAGLPPVIIPNSIRNSLDFICWQEGFPKEKLPLR